MCSLCKVLKCSFNRWIIYSLLNIVLDDLGHLVQKTRTGIQSAVSFHCSNNRGKNDLKRTGWYIFCFHIFVSLFYSCPAGINVDTTCFCVTFCVVVWFYFSILLSIRNNWKIRFDKSFDLPWDLLVIFKIEFSNLKKIPRALNSRSSRVIAKMIWFMVYFLICTYKF